MEFIDFFAGIGGFHSGLTQAGHECVGWVEWDKYARQSYEALYDTKGLYTEHDIKEVKGNELPNADIWAFGSPCTNISIAGNKQGLEGEASSMFFEVIRCLKERDEHKQEKPTYLLMENVKNLLSSNGGWDFAKVLIEMDEVGYDCEWNVFNTADYLPQNRERVYIIGHLRGRSSRQVFPISRESGSTTSQSQVKINVVGSYQKPTQTSHGQRSIVYGEGLVGTLTATDYKQPKAIAVDKKNKIVSRIKQIGNIENTTSFGGNPQRGRVYAIDGISPTLTATGGNGRGPKILIKNNTKQGYLEAYDGDGVDLSHVTSKTKRGRVQKQRSNTLTTSDNLGVAVASGDEIKLRKLTPLECWRLQGFTDEQFYKAKSAGVSDTQLYKQAGNAVSVPVVYDIAKELR